MRNTFQLLTFLASFIAFTAHAQFSSPITLSDDISNSLTKSVDLNNDGFDDILLLSKTAGKLRYYMNDGAGNFSLEQELLGTFPSVGRILIRDVDNDGWKDMVVLYAGSPMELALHRTQPGGVIGPKEVIYSYSGTDIIDACFTKNNADDYPEIAVYRGAYSTITLLNNNAGTYTATPIINGGINGPSMNASTALTSVDMDGDGDEDLMTDAEDPSMINISTGFPSYSVWFRNDGGGVYTMMHYDIRTSNNGGTTTKAVDLTGDGLPEYINFSNGSNTIIWFDNQNPPYTIGVGYGTLGGTILPSSSTINIYQLNDILFEDFNNDGAVDIVAHTLKELYLFVNNGSNTFTPVQIYEETSSYPAAGEDEQFHFDAGDFNNDGLLDLCVTNLYDDDFFWLENNGANTFTQHFIAYNASFPKTIYPFDHNNDGLKDLYVAYIRKLGIHKFEALDTAAFASNTPLVLGPPVDNGYSRMDVYENDMDSDGDLDLVWMENSQSYQITNFYWLENTPTNPMSVKHDIAPPVATRIIRMEDINNDGIRDLIGCGSSGIYIQYGLGGANYSPLTYISNLSVINMHVKDLDGDGWKDIVYIYSGVQAMKNMGDGTFGAPTPTMFSTHSSEFHLDFGDLNNDGLLDMVGTASGSGFFKAHVYLNQGNFSFAMQPTFFNTWNLSWRESQIADIDLDGDNDMLAIFEYNNTQNYTWVIRWYENTGNATFIEHAISSGIEEINDVVLTDIDEDGDLDPLFTMKYDKVLYYRNDVVAPMQLSGTIFVDLDTNGVYDANEPKFPFGELSLNPGSLVSFTNYDGHYFFSVDSGDYVLSASGIDTSFWELTTDSLSFNLTLDSANPVIGDVNFGFSPKNDSTILVTTLQGIQTGCDLTVRQHVIVRNEGGSFPAGLMTYSVDTNVVITAVNPAADSIVANTIYWHFDSLFYFEEFQAYADFTTPGVATPIDSLHFSISVEGFDESGNTAGTWVDDFSGPFTCAYDPNNKVPSDYGYTEEGFILPEHESLTYTINFQNTGTDTAYTVKIGDQLSTNLDWGSLRILGSSHNVDTYLSASGQLLFTLNDINLPDSAASPQGSKGFVIYEIDLLDNLQPGDQIENFAAIYFDLNPPIITNTTLHTIFDCNWMKGVQSTISELCVNDSSEIQSTGSYIENYLWSVNGEPTSSTDVLQYVVADLSDDTIQLTVNNPLCSIDTLMVVASSGMRPELNALAESVELCPNTTIELNAGVDASQWSGNQGVITTDSIVQINAAGLYTVLAGTGNCLSYDTIVVVEAVVPVVSISSPEALFMCDSSSIELISNNQGGNTWLFEGEVIGSASSIDTDMEGWYVLSVDAGNCADVMDSVLVQYYNPVQASINPASAVAFCDGGSVVLNAPEGSNTWELGGQVIATGEQVTATVEGWYVLTYQDTLCAATQDSIYVTVEEEVQAEIVAVEQSFCTGDSALITASATAVEWYANSVSLGTNDSLFCTESGWYVLEQFGTLCPSDYDSVYIEEVLPLEANLDADAVYFCEDDTVELTFSVYGILYNDDDEYLDETGTFLVQNPGIYYVEVINAPCPVVRDSIELVQYQIPQGPFLQVDYDIISLNETEHVAVEWYVDGNVLSGETTDSIQVTENGTYAVLLTFENGCTAYEEIYYGSAGLEEHAHETFKLYPSPARETLFLEATIPFHSESVIELLDGQGKLIRTIKVQETTTSLRIETVGLAPGLYFIGLPANSRTLRFVKQ